MTKHARLGASKAHRWITCPASVAMEATLPDETSFFAAEGTAAHTLAELCLTQGHTPEQYIGSTVEGFEVDEHMAEHVATYVDYINMQTGLKMFEVRVDYSNYAEGGFGTADCIVANAGIMQVIDLKFGQGVKVFAKDNAQLMLYALGAFHQHGFDFQIDTVAMTIVQPRLDHIDTYTMRVVDLLQWAKLVVRPAAEEAMSRDPSFNPSKSACRFCKAKASCRALAKHNLDLTIGRFENLDEIEVQTPHSLTPDEISKLLPNLDMLISWAQAVQSHATSVIKNGGVIPNFKLVEGRSMRRWQDESKATEKVLQILGDDAFTSKLKSPAQVEKLLGRKRCGEVSDLIVKPAGRPTLTTADDPRPEMSFDSIFDDLNEE